MSVLFSFCVQQMQQIRGCTLGDGGHAAFASIMWSPPLVSKGQDSSASSGDFYDCLKHVSCNVLLVFGKDDPWCKPAFARSMLLSLEERKTKLRTSSNDDGVPVHCYYEISDVGHCPNHEAPKAVSHLLNEWIAGRGSDSTSRTTDRSFSEEWGETLVRERSRDDIRVGWVDRIVTAVL